MAQRGEHCGFEDGWWAVGEVTGEAMYTDCLFESPQLHPALLILRMEPQSRSTVEVSRGRCVHETGTPGHLVQRVARQQG
jgi:hypothetical protein